MYANGGEVMVSGFWEKDDLGRLRCPICHETVAPRATVSSHMSQHPISDDFTMVGSCPICGVDTEYKGRTMKEAEAKGTQTEWRCVDHACTPMEDKMSELNGLELMPEAMKIRKIREQELEIDRLKSMTYCAYCGIEFPLDDDAANQVSEHIRTCDKHPLREVEAESDRRLALLRRVYDEDRFPCLFCGGGKESGCEDDCELDEELGND